MSTIYGEGEDGGRTIEFDSRWRYPYLLGFRPEDPEYEGLQEMWEQYTGETIPSREKPGSHDFEPPDGILPPKRRSETKSKKVQSRAW